MSTIQNYSIDFGSAMTAFDAASAPVGTHFEEESAKIEALLNGGLLNENFYYNNTLYVEVTQNPFDPADYVQINVSGTELNKILGTDGDLDLATGTVSITNISCEYPKEAISLSLTTSGNGVVMNFDTGVLTGNLTGMQFHSPWLDIVAAGSVDFSGNTMTDVFAINALFSEVSFILPQSPFTIEDDYKLLLKGAVNYSQDAAGLFTFTGSLTEAQILTPSIDLVYRGNLSCSGANNGDPVLTGEVSEISLSSADGTLMLSGNINYTGGILSGTIDEVKFDSNEQYLVATNIDVNVLTLFDPNGSLKDYNGDGDSNSTDIASFIYDMTKPGMTIYNWSELAAGTITFDPTRDQIFIDDPSMTMNSLTKWTWQNSLEDFVMADATKEVVFLGLGQKEVGASTMILASGGKFLIGDLLVTTLNDDSANTINGSEFDDVLIGMGGNDALNGGDGNDRIMGSSGSDLLHGGNGIDMAMYSGLITDPVFATLQGGYYNSLFYAEGYGTQQGGIDTFISIEKLRGGAGDDVLAGNGANNWLGGGLGNDTLHGAAGNDTLDGMDGNDILDGGTGADYMIGGLGNDTYYVDNLGDSTTETSALPTEIDTVLSSVTRTLVANLENLTLTGTAAINGTGNELANTLVGNSAANVLNGGGGVDTLILSGLPCQYKLNGNSLTGPEGLDTVSSIEQYRFGSSLGNPLCAANLNPVSLIDPDGAGPADSPATDLLQSISDLYVAYFNRAPDITGLMYWFSQISTGSLTLTTTAQSFTDSPEYKATYPAGQSNRDFINTIYLNLFDRAPDAGGWNYWENDLNHGSPRHLFIYTVIQGAYAPTGGAIDKALLNNKHDVSLYYSEQLATHTSEGFDKKIDQVLNRVTADPHTVAQAEAVIDYVIANPITLTGVISDTPTWDTFWA